MGEEVKFKDTELGSLLPYDIIQLLTNCVSLSPKPQHKDLVFASLDCVIDIFLFIQSVENVTHGEPRGSCLRRHVSITVLSLQSND